MDSDKAMEKAQSCSDLLNQLRLAGISELPDVPARHSLLYSPEVFYSSRKKKQETNFSELCEKGDLEVVDRHVRMVLRHYFDKVSPTTGLTPLQTATKARHAAVVEYLLEKYADPNFGDSRGYTALHMALASAAQTTSQEEQNKCYKIVEALLNHGADVTFPTKDRDCPLHFLVRTHYTPAVMTLFEKMFQAGADVDPRNKQNLTPLMIAASENKIEYVKALLDAGADVNATDAKGECALAKVLTLKDPDQLVKLLLTHGADPRIIEAKKAQATKAGSQISSTPGSIIAAPSSLDYGSIRSRAVFFWGRQFCDLLLESVNPAKIYGSGGGNHHAIITEGGHVYVWGVGTYGQLGLGDMEKRDKPQLLKQLSSQRVTTIALGNTCSCAVTENGTLYEWGDVGRGKVLLPKEVPGWKKAPVKQITIGLYHKAVLTNDGKIFTWGANTFGLLGLGDTNESFYTESPRQIESIGEPVNDISACYQHMGAVSVSGVLFLWGKLKETAPIDFAPKKMKYEEFEGYKVYKVVCSGHFTFVLLENGSLFSWGKGEFGVLGLGSTKDVDRPTKIQALANKTVCKVDANFTHAAALTVDGSIFTWGSKKHGNLGYDCDADQLFPKAMPAFEQLPAFQFSIGRNGNIALVDADAIPIELRAKVLRSKEEWKVQEDFEEQQRARKKSTTPEPKAPSLAQNRKDSKVGLRKFFQKALTPPTIPPPKKGDPQTFINWRTTDPVPAIIDQLLSILHEQFLKLSGLFRINAADRDVIELYSLFIDAGIDNKVPDLEYKKLDGHAVAGALKRFFIELKEPFFSQKVGDKLIAASKQADTTKKIADLKELISYLPTPSKTIFVKLMRLFAEVAKNSDVNLMTAENIAVCWSPCLFRSNSANPLDHLELVASTILLLTFIVSNSHEVTPLSLIQ